MTLRIDGETPTVGGGVLLAVGLAVVFFAGWTWWLAIGALLIAGGALWLRRAR